MLLLQHFSISHKGPQCKASRSTNTKKCKFMVRLLEVSELSKLQARCGCSCLSGMTDLMSKR